MHAIVNEYDCVVLKEYRYNPQLNVSEFNIIAINKFYSNVIYFEQYTCIMHYFNSKISVWRVINVVQCNNATLL